MAPDVRAYREGISSPRRRRDAETTLELMRRATGEEPLMWGSIVGFGRYHDEDASGRAGDSAAAGFAARNAATVVLSRSYTTLTAGTSTERAREGGRS